MISTAATVRKSLSAKLQKLTATFPSVQRVPLAWGEMDMFRHINNVWMLRYLETARFAHFYQCLKQHLTDQQANDFLNGTGQGIIVKSTFINYKAPAEFPDNLILATTIGNFGADRYTQYTMIFSERNENLIAKGHTIIVSYNHDTKQKQNLPNQYLAVNSAAEKEFGPQIIPKL